MNHPFLRWLEGFCLLPSFVHGHLQETTHESSVRVFQDVGTADKTCKMLSKSSCITMTCAQTVVMWEVQMAGVKKK